MWKLNIKTQSILVTQSTSLEFKLILAMLEIGNEIIS